MTLIQVFTINKMALLKIKHYISISSPSKTLIVWSIKVIFFKFLINFLLYHANFQRVIESQADPTNDPICHVS